MGAGGSQCHYCHKYPCACGPGTIDCPDCDNYTHVCSLAVLKRLPRDYSGELCQECGLWMCDKAKIQEHVNGKVD